jgi:hypothetical protein
LHRFLNREDDAFRSAGLLASASLAPSRFRSGYYAGIAWPLQQHVCPGFTPDSHLPSGFYVAFLSRPSVCWSRGSKFYQREDGVSSRRRVDARNKDRLAVLVDFPRRIFAPAAKNH